MSSAGARRTPTLTKMALSKIGIITYGFVFLGCVLLITSWSIGGARQAEADDNSRRGELAAFYQVPTCPNVNTSFGFKDGTKRLGFDGHTMRADTVADGVACPVVPTESGSLDIFVPYKDCEGAQFESGQTYKPVVMLPSDAYASITLEVRQTSGAGQADGGELIATTALSLGPDEQFPWMIEGAETFPLGSSVMTATCGVCDTSLDCGYSGDGVCDDGGSGSLYNLCPLGHDCADCGTRSCAEYQPNPPPPPKPNPPPPNFNNRDNQEGHGVLTGRRLLFGGMRTPHSPRAELAARGTADARAHDAYDEAYDDDGGVRYSPTSRRLLKGGWGGNSHGGRAGGVGSARWGSSTPSRVSSRSSVSTYRSSNGGVYGGRSYYYVGGRRCARASSSYGGLSSPPRSSPRPTPQPEPIVCLTGTPRPPPGTIEAAGRSLPERPTTT